MSEHGVGRILLLRFDSSLDGTGPTPEDIAGDAARQGAKFLIIDARNADFVDTGGIRWLLKLRSLLEAAGRGLRLIARRSSRVWKNLNLLQIGIDLYDNASTAWRSPWKMARTSA